MSIATALVITSKKAVSKRNSPKKKDLKFRDLSPAEIFYSSHRRNDPGAINLNHNCLAT